MADAWLTHGIFRAGGIMQLVLSCPAILLEYVSKVSLEGSSCIHPHWENLQSSAGQKFKR